MAGGGRSGLSNIYAGRVISGFGIGAMSAVAPAYVSECSPKDVRGRITGIFQIMVATGVMISYFINCERYPSYSCFWVADFLLDGVGLHVRNSPSVWRIPLGFQLVPAGIMLVGLYGVQVAPLFCTGLKLTNMTPWNQESPRWLVSVNRKEDALRTLVYLRKDTRDSEAIMHELAEIKAAIAEERDARTGLGFKEAFFGKGNFNRFVIAFMILALQQWSGQNSVGYYAPQIFSSVRRLVTSPPCLRQINQCS